MIFMIPRCNFVEVGCYFKFYYFVLTFINLSCLFATIGEPQFYSDLNKKKISLQTSHMPEVVVSLCRLGIKSGLAETCDNWMQFNPFQ